MEIGLWLIVAAIAPLAVAMWNWLNPPVLPVELPPSVDPPPDAQFGPPADMQHGAAWPNSERIGIILVHGIGEQRRFEHLDSQLRGLIQAAQQHPNVEHVSVDISGGKGAAFHAQQDTWSAGPEPSVTIVLRHRLNQPDRQPDNAPLQETNLFVHEVWWADVNERYSIAKQIRFWWWGLTVWAFPVRAQAGRLSSANRVVPPVLPGRSWVWDRIRLWMVAAFFMLLGYSVGALTFLLTRLFNLDVPDILKTITNYISAVKLYNQEARRGPNLLLTREDFLDTIDEPPRVSIRRRMIRAIADVACNRYHRWYVLAHSQGSIVAFNGLMETAFAWPGYLDESRWERLKQRGMAGPAGVLRPLPSGPVLPRRPDWAASREIVYRSRVFSRLRGFLTYGCPLEKFAGLWPALVPISREFTFAGDLPWLNIYDPVDPVSGKLVAFQKQPAACCPRPRDVGYAADRTLLVAHLKYLKHRNEGDLASLTIDWMLTDNSGQIPGPAGRGLATWFASGSRRDRLRSQCIAWPTWIFAAVLLALLGALVLPALFDAFIAGIDAILVKFGELLGGGG